MAHGHHFSQQRRCGQEKHSLPEHSNCRHPGACAPFSDRPCFHAGTFAVPPRHTATAQRPAAAGDAAMRHTDCTQQICTWTVLRRPERRPLSITTTLTYLWRLPWVLRLRLHAGDCTQRSFATRGSRDGLPAQQHIAGMCSWHQLSHKSANNCLTHRSTEYCGEAWWQDATCIVVRGRCAAANHQAMLAVHCISCGA